MVDVLLSLLRRGEISADTIDETTSSLGLEPSEVSITFVPKEAQAFGCLRPNYANNALHGNQRRTYLIGEKPVGSRMRFSICTINGVHCRR